jgi:hypothetical protein
MSKYQALIIVRETTNRKYDKEIIKEHSKWIRSIYYVQPHNKVGICKLKPQWDAISNSLNKYLKKRTSQSLVLASV